LRGGERQWRDNFNAKFYLMTSLPSTMGTIYCQVFKKLSFKTLSLREVNKKDYLNGRSNQRIGRSLTIIDLQE